MFEKKDDGSSLAFGCNGGIKISTFLSLTVAFQ